MNPNQKQNAVQAILGEYEKTIVELQHVIQDMSADDLAYIVDHETQDSDCKSIQTVLAHVVSAGYSYCIYIKTFKNILEERPTKKIRLSSAEYIQDLDNVIAFTRNAFLTIYDHELEVYDQDKKVLTSWKQTYDIEQMMEHAIVHVLRHRRQIEKFKTIVSNRQI